MPNKYDGISFETLAKHADEGWDLANTRTAQLREAIEALKAAQRLILFHGHVPVAAGEEKMGFETNSNYQTFTKVLEWGCRMFPGPGETFMTVVRSLDPELEKRRDHDL